MLRAALKQELVDYNRRSRVCLDTHNAACGIETT